MNRRNRGPERLPFPYCDQSMTQQKKNRFFIILFAAVAILGAAGIALALILPVNSPVASPAASSEIPTETEEPSESAPDSTEESSEAEPSKDAFGQDDPSEPIPETKEVPIPVRMNENAVNIWVGDSRMVGIANSGIINPVTDVFIARGAMAFDWFDCRGNYRTSGAMISLKPYLESGRKLNVIIQMGINDCANNFAGWNAYTVSDYIGRINELIAAYPNVRFYFISVGRNAGYYGGAYGRLIHPRDINPLATDFNCRMYYDCDAVYLAVGEAIAAMNVGKGPGIGGYADGVHYNNATNRWIYQYVLDHIASGIRDEFIPYPEEPGPVPTVTETEDQTGSETEDESTSEPETEPQTFEESASESETEEESGPAPESSSETESEPEETEPTVSNPPISEPETLSEPAETRSVS